jgi:hypothetical protein
MPLATEGDRHESRSSLPASPDGFGQVTYTLKVVRTGTGDAARRTVLFQRRGAGDAIEISAETDAPNLLALLPDLLDAAFSVERALGRDTEARPSSFPSFPEESRLLRRLTEGGGATLPPSALRVTGAAILPAGRRGRT